MSDAAETGKRAAAEAAVALVEDGMLLGLGTGSTMRYAIEAIGRRVREERLMIECVPTSTRTESAARHLGIPLTDFSAVQELDLAIDGADEVQDGTLALIKGLGGALLREKIVASASRRFVVVADASKLVETLGSRAPVPVEVVSYGHELACRRLHALGGQPKLRHDPDGRPYVTDGGNVIYDCHGFAPIADPADLDASLCAVIGVVETGLFPAMAEAAYIAEGRDVRLLRRAAGARIS